MIEITTIGAGGGSIARINAGGFLEVGPESAGSDPGPACYGAGNSEPTLTDANLVLGRINAARPIGDKLARLDVEAARQAIADKIGKPLSLDVEDASEAILRVANAKMAGAIRLVSIERGHDPAKFHAMPFGGGGALHAGALIMDCGLSGAIVPRYPGVTSALGCIVADMRHDRVKTINCLVDQVDTVALDRELREVAEELESVLRRASVEFEGIETHYELDMLYLGQTHTVSAEVKLADEALRIETIVGAFEAAYLASYGRLLENIPKRVMNYRVAVIGRRPPFDLKLLGPSLGHPACECIIDERDVYCDRRWHTAPIYDRLPIASGETVNGPCLLEQPDTTIFIDPGLQGRVDDFWNLIIERAS